MEQRTGETLEQENARLRERVAELEQEKTALTQAADNYRQSEERLQAILNSMTDNVLVWDGNYDYLYANQAAIDHVGTTRDKVIGKNMRDGLGHIPEFMRLWMQRVDHVLATNEPLRLEEAAQVGEKTVYSESILYPMRDAEQKPVAVALVYRDVTERKQQEEELRLARFTIDNTTDQIYWVDMQAQNIYVNQAACTTLGYTREELLSLRIPDIDPNFPMEQWPAIRDEVKQHGSFTFETLHQRKDGSQFPAEVSASYLVYNDQEYICAFARDITERKQQEAELHMFKAMADTAPDGFGVGDSQGMLIYANAAYREMTGYGDDLVGMHFTEHFSPERQSEAMTAITEISANDKWRGLLHFQRPDGSEIPVETTGFVIRDAQDNLSAMIGLFRDMTAQQRMEQERQTLQQQLIDAQRDALRELSTPLIPITDNVVIMPLIGTIDSQRAQQVMEALLEGVAQHQAELVILDITGVSVVDTQVAQAFIQAAQAVRLLGAQVMLTGIQPQIAQTLVTLGVDLTGIETQGSLQTGIAAALKGVHHTSFHRTSVARI